MNLTKLFVCAAMLGAINLRGQEAAAPTEKEAPPAPPLMKNAPSSAQWTISYVPKVPSREPSTPEEIRNRKIRIRYSPLVLSRRILKSGGQVVIYTNYEANLKSEAWVIQGTKFEMPITEGDNISAESWGPGDFGEIHWVKPEHFKGTVIIKGRKLHAYDSSVTVAPAQPATTPAGTTVPPPTAAIPSMVAYIDPESRLPLYVDDGSVVATYQYSAAPSSFPVPDARVKKIMDDAAIEPARP